MPKARLIDDISLEEKCRNWPQPDSRGFVTQTGAPLSAVLSHNNMSDANLAVVLNVDGKQVLGYVVYSYNIQITIAAALLQAEIADGDNDYVTFSGLPSNVGIELRELKVHGYTINFR